jgi:hypothetical protein
MTVIDSSRNVVGRSERTRKWLLSVVLTISWVRSLTPNAAVNFLTCAWCTVRTHEPCVLYFESVVIIDNQLESTMSVVWIVFKLTGLNIPISGSYIFPDLQTSGKKIRVYYVGIAPGQRSFSNDTSPPSRRYRQESILLRWPSRTPSVSNWTLPTMTVFDGTDEDKINLESDKTLVPTPLDVSYTLNKFVLLISYSRDAFHRVS